MTRSVTPRGIALVEAEGALLGGNEVDEFRRAVDECIEERRANLLIDLDKVTFINSTAVGVLASAIVSYSRRKWKIKLCGQNKVVYSILKITKLNLVIDSYETRAAALASFPS